MSNWKRLAILMAIFGMSSGLQAGTNYVSATHGSDSNSGADWGNAWATLPYAVAQSAAGDTVVLSNDVYALAAEITVDKELALVGFGAAPEEVILQPAGSRVELLYLNHALARVEKLTVRNGNRGIYLNSGGTVRRCLLYGHYGARGVSCGVYLNGGLVEHCVITNNTTGDLGAVVIKGGGILRNCLVRKNNCTTGNDLSGGVHFSGPGLAESCTIIHNHADNQSGGIYKTGTGTAMVSNSIVMFNSGPYANRYGTFVIDAATIISPGRDVDPQFVDPANGDCRLRPGSPAIDTGADKGWMESAADLDGRPRKDGAVDVGAYEYTRGALDVAFFPSARSGFTDEAEIVYTAAAEGTNTAGLVYVWDFDANGVVDVAGTARSAVTNLYAAAGFKSVRLTVTNAVSETASFTFTNAVKIGPRTAYVDRAANTDAYPYDSWATAASNLQAAVDVAVDGSVVKVGGGTYLLGATVTVSDGVTLESVTGAAGTVLDGQNARTCLWLAHSNAVARGFTIQRGFGEVGGVLLRYGGTLSRCRVINNRNASVGYTTAIGGVSANGPACLVEQCAILGNSGSRYGAAGGTIRYDAVMRNSLVAGNWTIEAGGDAAGGVVINRGGTLDNCTVVRNYALNTSGAGGVSVVVGGLVRNSIVTFNQGPSATYDNIRGGTLTTSTVGTDPLFVAGGSGVGETHVAGDYRLQEGSPAIDAGTFSAWMSGATDLADRPRIYNNATVDRGAYEWHPPHGTMMLMQ